QAALKWAAELGKVHKEVGEKTIGDFLAYRLQIGMITKEDMPHLLSGYEAIVQKFGGSFEDLFSQASQLSDVLNRLPKEQRAAAEMEVLTTAQFFNSMGVRMDLASAKLQNLFDMGQEGFRQMMASSAQYAQAAGVDMDQIWGDLQQKKISSAVEGMIRILAKIPEQQRRFMDPTLQKYFGIDPHSADVLANNADKLQEYVEGLRAANQAYDDGVLAQQKVDRFFSETWEGMKRRLYGVWEAFEQTLGKRFFEKYAKP